MKKANKNKNLSVADKMKAAEDVGAKVAKIMNKARAQANKILAKSGYEVNVNVDFLKIEQKTEEVKNG